VRRLAMSDTRTVRISRATHDLLALLADREGRTMADVLAAALEGYRRDRFFEDLDAGYAALKADPAAWEEHERDREAWGL